MISKSILSCVRCVYCEPEEVLYTDYFLGFALLVRLIKTFDKLPSGFRKV